MEFIGLRYFNVFGPNQDPSGAYAAVIPLFAKAILMDIPPTINGDGKQSRDFTFVDNAVQANIKALFTKNKEAINQVYNIACGEQITIKEMFDYLAKVSNSDLKAIYGPDRIGDVKHSLADISKAKKLLGYEPSVNVRDGLVKVFSWYADRFFHGKNDSRYV